MWKGCGAILPTIISSYHSIIENNGESLMIIVLSCLSSLDHLRPLRAVEGQVQGGDDGVVALVGDTNLDTG